MPVIDENMQFAVNNWAKLLNQYIIIIFMKSIFYFYDVHIQEKITMKVEWTEKIWFWFMVLTTTGQWNPWIMNRAPTSSYNTLIWTAAIIFMPPAWKVRRGHLVIGSSIRLFVHPSVRLFDRDSVPCTNKVKYLKFGWWFSNQTGPVGSFIGASHFNDIPHPWGWGGIKM